MPWDFPTFLANLEAVRAQIAAACVASGRNATTVGILPVTKTLPVDAVLLVARAGLPAVGENRVQEAIAKRAQVATALRWELIGHLQSNKAALAARHFDRVQSVDSTKLLDLLDRAAAEVGRVLPVLLQVNAGHDPAKYGVEPADAPALLAHALKKPALRVEGLMTIAPLLGEPDAARRTFAALRELRDRLVRDLHAPLDELSMGMTADLAAAVAEGSTLVRVGTGLFGAREPAAV